MSSDFSQKNSQLSSVKRLLLKKRLRGRSLLSSAGQTIFRSLHSEIEARPLSFSQQRLWFIEQFEGGNAAYNIPFGFRLQGQLHIAALERSLNEIVRRHEILRSSFTAIDGRSKTTIVPTLSISLPIHDLREFPKEQRDAEVNRWSADEAGKPFNLTQCPLFRCVLLRVHEQEFIFLFTIHHIVFDGWSIEVFMRELSLLYDAFSHGKASPLPELPIQYADFAQWQHEWLKGDVLDRQISYWRTQLSNCPSILELPTDHPRPARQTFCGGTCSFTIPDSVAERLQALSQQEKSTVFMTLLAAFTILLYRYTGQEDLVVGSPIANRQRSELESLIGFFVNMLVLRTTLSGDVTFYELLAQVRTVTLEAQAHQDMPFDLLVEELHPKRDLNHHPFFQTAFAFRHAPEHMLKFPGLTIKSLPIHNEAAKFDLFLEIVATERGLSGSFEYNTDLFNAETILRMARHFQILLKEITTTPERRISELSILTETEQHQILKEWNDTKTDYPKNASIHALFEMQAQQTPNAIAVVFKDRQFSYQELNSRANQLAHYLRRIGVGPEVLVGICMERSLEMIVGLLGILKAGGAYVPFDVTYPRKRLTFILEDTHVPIVLTQHQLVEKLPSNNATVMCLDSNWGEIAGEHTDNPICEVDADNLAYVMYTSGSTGKPKGVCITQRGVVRLVKRTNYADLTANEIFLQYAPISFDASTFEIWGCLLNGGRLVMMPYPQPSLEELGRIIQHDHITTLWLTAGLFHLMVENQFQALRSVRQLLAGGDVLSVVHVQKVLQETPECTLINGYGPTENTTFTCCFPMTGSDTVSNSVPIGRPIANTCVHILDRQLNPVPVGVPGELHIGGDGLARGYLNRPELTQEKFIPNPFSDDPKARLYKTGDLARYLPDGNIEFLGRIDHQVKIRGFRIELGEIESVLLQHQAIREAVVIARENDSGDKQLAAYLVVHQGQDMTVSEIRKSLKKQLPDYMVPVNFTFLEALPLTPNGKIDRRALPEPDAARPNLDGVFVAPRTPAEQTMARLWSFLLNVDRIGIYDNFFELGGHSLLTVQLMASIEETFQVKVPMWKLFDAPTVAGLVAAIEAEQWIGPDKPALEEQPIDPQVEVLLDETIRPVSGDTAQSSIDTSQSSILLTGATGFLGAFLLHELLQQTSADVYCLVRASGQHEGQQRIRETLQQYEIWFPALAHRIIAVPGDLTKPKFGLSDDQFEQVAQQIDVIYHSGAQVNLVYPYSALKATNVGGTHEILRLAAHHTVKPVHYISTLGVFPHPFPNEPIAEDTPLPPFESLTVGYAQSKWVAEKLIAVAHSRGIPCSIYRPGRISGHSQTGVWNTEDFACRMLKGCIEMGIAPQQHITTENWAPVDYVSRAIVHLSQKPASRGQVFHIVNQHPLDWKQLLAWLGTVGYPLKTLSYERWRNHFCDRAAENALTPMKAIFQAATPSADPPQRFAYWNTVAGLEGSTIACPRVSPALLHTYTGYFLRSGFLNMPQNWN